MMKQLPIFLLIFLFSLGTQNIAQILPDFQVNENDGGVIQSGSSISIDKNGNFIVTWAEGAVYAKIYSSDGKVLSDKIGDKDVIGEFHPDVSSDGEGNFVITWKSMNDIWAQRYSKDGTQLGSHFRVNDVEGCLWSSYSGLPRSSIASADNGDFVITWLDGRNGYDEIYAQRYRSDGKALGCNFKVDEGDDNSPDYLGPAISSDSNGNFVITWSDKRNGTDAIYAQRYSSDGKALGHNFKVNDYSVLAIYPSISLNNNGNFVVAWCTAGKESYYLYAQRFSDDGTPLGNNFRVNDIEGSYFPSISLDDRGNFVITWHTSDEIYAQRYLSNGSALGDNFKVSNLGYFCDVKLWNGKIYNTWITGYAGADVWANVLDWENPSGIIEREMPKALKTYKLSQNHPNPFNPSTTIEFALPKVSDVRIEVFNVGGQRIQTLLNEKLAAGKHHVKFSAHNLSSGLYFYKIDAGEFHDVKKMILLK
jgi:hypothetical protein